MAIGSRELLVVLRARNLTTGALRDVSRGFRSVDDQAMATANRLMTLSQGLTTAGLTIGAIGAAGLSFFNDAVKTAETYNNQVAHTLTQTRGLGIEFEELADVGRNVARSIGVPFEEIQPAMFLIFSTLDHLNLSAKEAESVLAEFAKGAVAGQTDITTAATATMAIMNAYGLTAKDVSKVMDFQFQLVKTGTGTYSDFANTIGLSLPAAVAAGQSIDTLGGMLAFLTKQGLSASRASTSTARALEMLTQPKTVAALEEYGVAVRDANGEFLQMTDIIRQLAVDKGWASLTGPERKKAFQEVFGTGSIQARRFFDTAIPNFELLETVMRTISDQEGALENAYGIMFDQPVSQIQILSNQYQALKSEIGDQLLPAKMRLVEVASNLLKAWENLNPALKRGIVLFASLASVVLVIVGAVLTITGVFLAFKAMLVLTGVAFSTIVGIVGIVIAVIAALGVAIYLIITHWDTLKRWGVIAWEAIKDAASATWDFLKQLGANIGRWASSLWEGAADIAVNTWNTITDAVSAFWEALQPIRNGLGRIWDTLFAEGGKIISGVAETVGFFGRVLKTVFDSVVVPAIDLAVTYFNYFVDQVTTVFKFLWRVIQPIIAAIAEIFVTSFRTIRDIVSTALQTIADLWRTVGGNILSAARAIWDGIVQVVSGAIELVSGVIRLVMSVIRGDWSDAWEAIKSIVSGAWNIVTGLVSTAWTVITNLFSAGLKAIPKLWSSLWEGIKTLMSAAWDILLSTLSGLIDSFVQFFKSLPGLVLSALSNFGTLLVESGKALLRGLKSGAESLWTNIVRPWLANLPTKIKNVFSGAINWLSETGKSILRGLFNGIANYWSTTLWPWIRDIPSKIVGAIPNPLGFLWNAGYDLLVGLKNGVLAGFEAVKNSLLTPFNWIKGLIPGSPVKHGPLRVLNRGYAGKEIVRMIAGGMQQEFGLLEQVSTTMANKLAVPQGFGNLAAVGVGSSFGAPQAGQQQQGPMIHIENATFGDEKTVDDVDYFLRTQRRGIW